MKTLLLDIETAPNLVYTWGLWHQNISINQIVKPGYVLCWAAKWLDEKEIMFASCKDNKNMLLSVSELIDKADVVVHYNGTRFDMPWLYQSFLEAGIPPPSPVMEIDLLKIVRKKFKLLSNKLDYVSQFLGVGSKYKHPGMSMWIGCMNGDDKSWKEMEKYNKQDVRILPRLYSVLLPWIPNHPNHALFTKNDKAICPNCGSQHLQKRGFYFTKTLSYQRYHCQGCGSWSRQRTNSVSKEKRANTLVGVM